MKYDFFRSLIGDRRTWVLAILLASTLTQSGCGSLGRRAKAVNTPSSKAAQYSLRDLTGQGKEREDNDPATPSQNSNIDEFPMDLQNVFPDAGAELENEPPFESKTTWQRDELENGSPFGNSSSRDDVEFEEKSNIEKMFDRLDSNSADGEPAGPQNSAVQRTVHPSEPTGSVQSRAAAPEARPPSPDSDGVIRAVTPPVHQNSGGGIPQNINRLFDAPRQTGDANSADRIR